MTQKPNIKESIISAATSAVIAVNFVDIDLSKEMIMIIKDFLWGNIKTQKKKLI